MSLRMKRVEKEIKELLGKYLSLHFPYKNEVIVSISNVSVSNDLKQARVYYTCYSPLDTDVDKKLVEEVLEEERSEMQDFISKKIKMKYTPKLQFFHDPTFEENFSVIKKLRDLGYAKVINPSDDV